MVEDATAIDRFARWAPATGLAFIVLALIGGFALQGSTPGAGASGARVIAFYEAHRSRERAGAIVIAFALVAFLFFATSLRAAWRRQNAEALGTAVLAAATVMAVGITGVQGVVYALTDHPSRLGISTAHTLNVLVNDVFITIAVGAFMFGIACALAIFRTRSLPTWLGWLAILIAVLWVTPLEAVGFFLLLAWVATVSVLLLRSPGR